MGYVFAIFSAFGAVLLGIIAAVVYRLWVGSIDHDLICRDLRNKGCRPVRIRRRLFARGLLTQMRWDSDTGPDLRYGGVYDVVYLDPDGRTAHGTCMTGPRDVLLWTDDEEPGRDLLGHARNLPTHGQNWRG